MQKANLVITVFIILTNFLVGKSNGYFLKECSLDEAAERFQCYNGGVCMEVFVNSTYSMKMCSCKPGFTGKQCTQMTTPCSPNPCAPNGYCNSALDDSDTERSNPNKFFCRCKPGFSGERCQEDINDCLNATCQNGGLCIDGINSYECECKWPFFGRYCQTKFTCKSSVEVCKNGGVCVDDDDDEDLDAPLRCICPTGFEGADCSIRVDPCKSQPCLYGGLCVSTKADYSCQCTANRVGKNCQIDNFCASSKNPCKNNSTCISLLSNQRSIRLSKKIKKNDYFDLDALKTPTYYCQCRPRFTGVNCDIPLSDCDTQNDLNCEENLIKTSTKPATTTTTTTSTTSTTSTKSTTDTILTSTIANKIQLQRQLKNNETKLGHVSNNNRSNNENGSLVLIINLDPDEFRLRKLEIVKEFERKLGFLIQIKKEAETNREMIYSFHQPTQNSTSSTETKVYFKIISACLFDSAKPSSSNNNRPTSSSQLCLSNSPDSFNQLISELKKDTDLLPSYVSNMTYEAYSTSQRKNKPVDEQQRNNSNESNVITTLLICLLVSFITGISIIFIVLIRQSNKRIKAPIWVPPIGDNNPSSTNNNNNNKVSFEKNGTIYETIQKPQNIWSAFGKKIDDFSSLFKRADSNSPNNNNDYDAESKPVKIRKLDNNKNEPDFFPSPPESLSEPEFNVVNFKSSNGMTPLMMFVLGRSKMKNTKRLNNVVESDVIDTLVLSGADLNSVNNEGETALHLAARFGLVKVVEGLVKNGADLNIFDASGKNPLHSAVGSNEYEVVKLILTHCAVNANQIAPNIVLDDKYDLVDSKTNDELGETSLIMSSRLGHNKIVELLIEFNATVNASDNEGRSALHWCAKVNNVDAALVLIQSGANVNMQDNEERTPFSTALNELCTEEMAELLVKFDAFVSGEDEVKLNKMKNIMRSLAPFNKAQNVSNELVNKIKQEQINNFKAATNTVNNNKELNKEKMNKNVSLTNVNNSNLKSKNKLVVEANMIGAKTSNKRKLSDTSQTENNSSKKVINQNAAYTPLTPSPPNYLLPTNYPVVFNNSFTNLANFNEQSNFNNPYLTQNAAFNFNESQRLYNQYYSSNPNTANTYTLNNEHSHFTNNFETNKNSNYYNNYQQQQQIQPQQQQQQQQQSNYNSSSLYYGEGYAAYF